MQPHKPPAKKHLPASNTQKIWEALIDAGKRSPADTKRSLHNMRMISLLDDVMLDFVIAALDLGGY